MSHKYFKPVVKYVSRKAAVQKLKLTEKQFDRLTVMFGMYPVVSDAKNCYDKVDGWYYRIDDIRRIFYSDTYEILKGNTEKETKRQRLLQFQQLERASKIINEEFNLVDLVRQKYESLGKSLDDLGNTLRNLYVIDLLSIDDVGDDLGLFERFVIERGLLNRAFMSRKGVYFGISVESIIVCWMVPYPGVGLDELVEEKADVPGPRAELNIDFLDFGSFSEDESEDDGIIDPNDPNKFDTSLLKYALPLLKIHLRLCVHKLAILYPVGDLQHGIFRDMKFHIEIKSIHRQIRFAIEGCGGELAGLEDAKFVIAETVDQINPGKIYLQPQYVFDCVNNGKMLSFEPYLVGKVLPAHISPFPNVIERIDDRSLKLLSNKRKYSILDRVEKLD